MASIFYHDTPVGKITVSASCGHIIGIGFGVFCGETGDVFEETPIIRDACLQLEEYFGGIRRNFDLPLSKSGTPFERDVYEALTKIPYGEVRTYGEIAKAIGREKACRAVGMANHKNPIPIIVPCHRVIGASGALTGYAGGIEIKHFLLQLEGARL